MIELRDYQQALFDDTRAAMAAGSKRVLCVAPTGAGKSYIFMAMAEAVKSGRVLILVHRAELLDQHCAELEKNHIATKNIVVASVQSVYRHLEEYGDVRLVIADEAHLFRARTFEVVLKHFTDRGAFCVGFTGSPVRLDGKPLGGLFDKMVIGPTTAYLIEHKRLAPYDYYAPLAVDVSHLQKRAGDYAIEDLETVMEPAIYGKVIEEYQRLCPDKQAIVFCVSIKHSQQVAQQFRDAGISAEHLDGNTPKKARKAIMERFRAGEVKVLTNCSLISEGLSVDGVGAILLLRPTASLALHLQMVGRGLRYQPGKVCTILDCVGNYTRHGLPDSPRDWSLTAPTKAENEFNEDGTLQLRVCGTCFKTFRTAPVCPFCGTEYELTPREIKAMEDVQLAKLEKEQFEQEQARKEQAKLDIRNARSYEDLLRIEKANGYKHGWARIRARLRGYICH